MKKILCFCLLPLLATGCVRSSVSIVDSSTVITSADTPSPLRDPERVALREGSEKLKRLGFDCYKIVGHDSGTTQGIVVQGNSFSNGYNSNSNFSATTTKGKDVKIIMVGTNKAKDPDCVPLSVILGE